MRWPWQRREAGTTAGGEQATPAVPEPVSRPRGHWRGLEPLTTVTGAVTGPASSAAEPLEFVRTLSTRWQVPAALEPLGHEVARTAPAGHVSVAGGPLQGYPEPPELVWAAVPEALPAVPAAPLWRGAAARPAGPDVQTPALRAPSAAVTTVLDLGRSASPTPAPEPDVVAVREVVRTGPPSAAVPRRGTPAAPSPAEAVGAPAPDVGVALSAEVRHLAGLRTEPTAAESVPSRPGVDPRAPLVAPPVRAVDVTSPNQEETTVPGLPVPQRAPSPPPTERAPEQPVAPSAPRQRPVTAEVPSPSPRRVRGLVGETTALVTGREPLRAGVEPVAASSPAVEVETAPPPVDAGRPATGLGVPDWFSSGAVRAVPPPTVPQDPSRPVAVEGPQQVVGRRALTAPADAQTEPAVGSRAPADREPGRVPPRRVPWPQPEDTAAAIDDGGGDDVEPSDVSEEAEEAEGPEQDSALGQAVAGRPDQHPDPGPAPVAARAWESPPAPPQSSRVEPLPDVTAVPRRFRVGAPLPRPAAAARAVLAPTGFAELATAAMAAASPAPEGGPVSSADPGRRTEGAVGRPTRGPRAGLVPVDLGLPTDTGPTAVARPASPDAAGGDEDDDVERPVSPSVDELYEQVRTRLRHELLVDRERAAMLAD